MSPSIPVGGQPSQKCAAILWVDDELSSADAIVLVLVYNGFAVDCARTNLEARRRLLAKHYDAILLDLRLCEESGLELLEWLTANGMAVPVVIVTGFADVASAAAAMRLGAADYITKPADGDHLAALLTTLVAQPQRSHPSVQTDREWLTMHASRLQASETAEEVVKIVLHAIGGRDLHLPAFCSCAQALRLAVTSSSAVAVGRRGELGRLLSVAASPQFPPHQKVLDALALLENDEGKGRISPKQFAKRLGLSRSYLSYLLTSQTHRTASEWCVAAMMRRVLRRILNTEEQISQIAYMAGYNHAGQFDRDFVRMFAATPTRIRNLFKLGDGR